MIIVYFDDLKNFIQLWNWAEIGWDEKFGFKKIILRKLLKINDDDLIVLF